MVTGFVQSQKLSQTQNSNRNPKDAQRYLEPGTPNVSPRSLSWTRLVNKTVLQDVLLLELFRITDTGECTQIIISVIIVVSRV